MSTKSEVLFYLEQSKGEFLSGGVLAERIGVSRNAVWKAIRQLEQEGHEIHSEPHKGYCLAAESSVLSDRSIEKYLKTKGLKISVFQELVSTNTAAKELAEQGAPEGTVIFARRQTGGRGRMGRSFFSPEDSGLYFSVLLRPKIAAKDALLITTCAAVAVSRTVEAVTGASCGIKWVNDVFCGDRKVCGILTEASLDLESGGLNYAVLGIGINVFEPKTGFPDELRQIAGAIVPRAAEGDVKSRIAAGVIDAFFAEYPHLAEKRFLDEYREKNILKDARVNVIKAGREPVPAEVLGIDEDLRLKVRYDDGTEEALSTGEVSVRVKNK